MKKSDKKWGFLASTREEAERMEAKYGVHFTPLIEYMKVIFPDIDDWEEKREIEINEEYIKPSLFSMKRKIIIQVYTKESEYDDTGDIYGLEKVIAKNGYKVYILDNDRQLTNTTVQSIWGINIKESLFDENTPTLTQPWSDTVSSYTLQHNIPYIKNIYTGDTKQYKVNIKALMNKINNVSLSKIIVDGLFGLYDYEIDLNAEKKISILIGPNGCGKTTILNMLGYMLTGGYIDDLIEIPFKSISCILSNGRHLELRYSAQNKNLSVFIDSEEMTDLRSEDGDFYVRDFYDLLKEKHCLFDINYIEAQRLYTRKYNEEAKDNENAQTFINTISDIKESFKRFCQYIEKNYDSEKSSNEHDLFEQYVNNTYSEKKLLSKSEFAKAWKEFSEKRNEYERNIAFNPNWRRNIINDSINEKIIEQYENQKINKREFLCTYLDTFKDTLFEIGKAHEKTKLFQKIINKRFEITKKQLRYRYQEMYLTVGEGKDKKEIPFDILSSGEKNDFIMFYKLIFESHDCLVLIDEPEISLHIEWQERFIDDLSEICEMNNIQALVATHSPNIINDHLDLIADWEIKDEDEQKH